jgi:putative phosphoesterase
VTSRDTAMVLLATPPVGYGMSGWGARQPASMSAAVRPVVAANPQKSAGHANSTKSVPRGGRPSSKPAADKKAAPEPRKDAGGPEGGRVRIGVISDNHGYLDPEILEIFKGVDHIIHAGDVMDPDILTALRRVAPLTAVSGNLDGGELAAELPREATGEIGGVRFVVAHKPRRLLKRLSAGKISIGNEDTPPDLVVWGHLHTPTASWVDGALYLNPGTASSPDEEDDGPTVAIVEGKANGLAVQFIPLQRRPE